MPDDRNDNLQNTAAQYEGIDPARFEGPEDLTEDQVASILMEDTYGGTDDGAYDEGYVDDGYAEGPETAIEAVAPTAAAQAEYKQELLQLQERNPSIFSEAATREWWPIAQGIARDFGDDAAANPHLIAMAYEQVGGERRFGAERESAKFADSIVNANPKTGSPFEP